MKISRILSVTAATALVVAGSVLVASPASASTTVDDATFYGASDFGVESGGYPTGVDWFFGDVTGVEGAHAFSNTGLTLNSPATGDVQILNQNVTTPADAGDLNDLVGGAEVFAQNDNWTFQVAFFAEGTSSTQFTTLRPATAGGGGMDYDDTWITSRAFATYSAGDTAPFSDFADALYTGEAPTLLAYGVFVDSSQTTTINGIIWDGLGSSFGAVPTRTMAPNPITPEAFSTPGQGLTLSGTNWFPGTAAYIYIYAADGTTVYHDTSSFIVDAGGNINVQVVLPTAPAAGNYYVTFDDDGFYYRTEVLQHYVTVPGDCDVQSETGCEGEGESESEGLLLSVAEAPALADTGAEAGPFVAGGILALLLGGALVVTTRRRRTA